MGPTEAVTAGLSTKYYAFTGRARRSEFWWFQLAVTIATNLTLLIPGTVADLVTALLTLALLVPTTAVAVRRLHDVGRSGWWLLLILVPVLGLIALILWWASPGDDETNAYGPPSTSPRVARRPGGPAGASRPPRAARGTGRRS